MNSDYAERVREALEKYLSDLHAKHAKSPIIGPDEWGAFPASLLNIHGESLIVVPDTMMLWQDVVTACRQRKRTTLITAVNAGALRMFCARHVLDEVLKHSAEWAARDGVQMDAFLARWNGEYLPLMRVIEDADLTDRILSSSELSRVRSLGASKDVPSVILCLALGGFYATKDTAAWSAVYGVDANSDELYEWLQVLMAGSNAGELGKLWFVTMLIPVLTVSGTFNLGWSIVRRAPWIFAPLILGVLALAASRMNRDTWRKVGAGTFTVLEVLNEILRPYYEALERFREKAAATADWDQLVSTVDPRAALLRACLYELARAPDSNMSAKQLSDKVEYLTVGRGEKLVRDTLRNGRCFLEVRRGRWQVGHP